VLASRVLRSFNGELLLTTSWYIHTFEVCSLGWIGPAYKTNWKTYPLQLLVVDVVSVTGEVKHGQISSEYISSILCSLVHGALLFC
jgi:hypothetical protein